MRSVFTAWRLTLNVFTSHRKLWLPFMLTACVEACFLALVWAAPHRPFSSLLAPPIRYFFGDKVLHYPAHLWFLYHVMKHTNLVASMLVGAFMSGIACVMVRQAHDEGSLSLREALVSRQASYGRLLLLWLVAWGVAKGVLEGVAHVAPKTLWVFWTIMGVALLLQALLVYTVPAAVFETVVWWKAFLRGLRESICHPVSTGVMVLLPSATIIAFSYFCHPGRLAQWMDRTVPEIAIVLVIARLIVWTVADALLTVGTTHLWLVRRAHVAAGASAVVLPAARRAVDPTPEVPHVETPVVA